MIYSRYLKHYIIFKLSSLAVIIFFCSSMKIRRGAIENLVKFFLKKLLTFKKLVCAQKMQEYVFYTLMFLKKIFQSVFFENLSFFCCKFDSADCSTLTLRSHSLRSRQKIIPKKSQLLLKK